MSSTPAVVPHQARRLRLRRAGWAQAIKRLRCRLQDPRGSQITDNLGLIVIGVGAWVYFRKGPGSRSGTANDAPPGATNAPSALGKSRKSPGDSRSS